jgi:hypothetical protein
MASPIVSKDAIRAEFDRIKRTHQNQFSDAEICILTLAKFPGLSLETVMDVCTSDNAQA